MTADDALGCPNLYTYPTATDNVDATKQVKFTWDTTCKVGSEKIDLYLYQSAANKLIKAYTGIEFASGSYEAQLMPGWWNNTEETTLYVNILKSGGMAWDTTWSRGPDFKVSYDFSSMYTVTTSNGVVMTLTAGTSSQSSDTVFQSVDQQGGHKTSKAVIAVAVVIPIVVLCLLGAVAFYFYRLREKEKLKRWSHALSSTSNFEWEKGALPGERVPSAYGRPSSHYSRRSNGGAGGRPSTHYSTTTGRQSQYGRPSTGYGRPSMSSVGRPTSSVLMDNMAGAGAGTRAMFPSHGEYGDGPTRSSIVMADGTTRQSRISFADRPRPSFNEVRPPMPHLGAAEASYATGSAVDDGPLTKRGSPPTDPVGTRDSVDALRDMEAAILIRNSDMPMPHGDNDAVEALEPEPEHDAARSAPSPIPGSSSIPTVAYGPDQMLAVYAQRGKVNASPVNTPGSPDASTIAPLPPAAKPSRPSAMKRLLSRKDLSSGRKTPTGRKTPSGGRETPSLPPAARDAAPSPEPMSMRSYVHLNNGTMSAAAVDNLPPPGPPGRSASRQSENSHYEDAYEGPASPEPRY